MSDHDVVQAQQTLRRHGIPVLGDIHLHNVDGRVEVRVEVNGEWRVAITEPFDGEGVMSHFVCCDGGKPFNWPLVRARAT